MVAVAPGFAALDPGYGRMRSDANLDELLGMMF
jgi:hypothetical protein